MTRPDGFSGQDWYFFRNIPVRWVRIVGVVVAVEDFSMRRLYTIDDSSGACIQAIVLGTHVTASSSSQSAEKDTSPQTDKPTDPSLQPHAPKTHPVASSGVRVQFLYDDVDVGTVVYIKGCLTNFREDKQIRVEKLVQVRSTMEEVALWDKRNRFYAEVLARPWVLSAELVQQCRRQAEKKGRRRQPRERARADKEPVRQGQQPCTTAKMQEQEGARKSQRDHKQQQRRAGLSRSELAKMISDGGVKGHFGALGL